MTTETGPQSVEDLGGGGSLKNVADIEAGTSHSCAVITDGTVACWGKNNQGQLGDGTIGSGGVGQLTRITAIATGKDYSCALRTAGVMACWGTDDAGQAGKGPPLASSQWPVVVSAQGGGGTLVDVATIFDGSGAARHSCAILGDDSTLCWGDNLSGQIGDGTMTPRNTPVALS